MKLKHSYYYEVQDSNDAWIRVFGEPLNMSEGIGYVLCHQSMPPPKEGLRLVRSDGRVVTESSRNTEAALGQGVGFPSAADYIRAATRALIRAARVQPRRGEEDEARQATVEALCELQRALQYWPAEEPK